jgi:hypothetical protein
MSAGDAPYIMDVSPYTSQGLLEDRWRREVHGTANGRVLDVVLSEHGPLTGLQLKELLVHMLPVGTDLLSIVLPNIEASEEALI